MGIKPFCFVLMPFGKKTDGNKKEINFNEVYQSFIRKAIEDAGLEPIRADEEQGGGFIHKPMYERLLFCDFAIADLSFANANVFYELGIRHTARPYTTLSIYEKNTKLPFDVAPLRTLSYEFEDEKIIDVDQKIQQLSAQIKINLNVQAFQADSPIGQLITGYIFPNLSSLQNNSDTFREWISTINAIKDDLNDLVKNWKQLDTKINDPALSPEAKQNLQSSKDAVVQKVKDYQVTQSLELQYNSDLLYALLNAFKSMSAFAEVEQLISAFLKITRTENVYLKQQLALALNKQEKREDAQDILTALIDKYGPDPETNGLLGSIYKGLMDDNAANKIIAKRYQQDAIEAYLAGFDADPREYYPGVNALTLLFFGGLPDERFTKYYPLVSYAVERQVAIKKKDYWLQATALELAVLELNEDKSNDYLAAALVCGPARWQTLTTAKNLKKIYNKALTNTPAKADQLKWLSDLIVTLQ
jgi:hypothetical protein